VYLSSAELAAVCSLLGKIPTVEEYMQYAAMLDETSADTYRYLNFNQLESYQRKADGVV
jgi:aconitate hydratase 2/2-methylisocitrate dehydratase